MVVKCADFQPEQYFSKCPMVKNRRGNPAGKKRHYVGITTAFDIETTLLDDRQTNDWLDHLDTLLQHTDELHEMVSSGYIPVSIDELKDELGW